MEQRKRRELLKDRRQAAVKSRLAKVRARRGNPPGQEKQENLEEGEIDAIETVERPKNQQVKVYEASDVMVDLVKSRKLEEERRVMTQLEWERGRLQFTCKLCWAVPIYHHLLWWYSVCACTAFTSHRCELITRSQKS